AGGAGAAVSVDAKRRLRARAVLGVDHLSAAALDRDDREQLMTVHDLPAVNASLNATSGVLLLIAYAFIRARRIEQHRRVMIAAFVASSLFLACYLAYHA